MPDSREEAEVKRTLKEHERTHPGEPLILRLYDADINPKSVTCIDPKDGSVDDARSEQKSKALRPRKSVMGFAVGVSQECRAQKSADQCIDEGQAQWFLGDGKRFSQSEGGDIHSKSEHPDGFIPLKMDRQKGFTGKHKVRTADGTGTTGTLDETIEIPPAALGGQRVVGKDKVVAKSDDPSKGPCTLEYDIELTPKQP